MYKDHVAALVASATSGWMPTKQAELSLTAKGRIHQRLQALLRLSGDSPRQAAALRVALIQEINAASQGVLRDALACIEVMKATVYAIEARRSRRDPVKRLTFELVPPASGAHDVLGLALALRSVQPREQLAVMQAYEAYEHVNNAEHSLFSEPLTADAESLARLARAVRKRQRALERLLSNLSPDAKAVLLERSSKFPERLSSWWCLPVATPLDASDAELAMISRWTKAAGSAMFMPLPLKNGRPAAKAAALRHAWSQYQECGQSLVLLGTWIGSLTGGAEGQRCEICYRHIGEGGRRFCSKHKRTAKTSRDSREAHVSTFYKQLVEKDVSERGILYMRFGAWRRSRSTLKEMTNAAVGLGIDAAIVQAASDLATTLAALRPWIRPKLAKQLEVLFQEMLGLAQEQFLEIDHQSLEARIMQRHGAAQAPSWLSWHTLLAHLFGEGLSPSWARRPLAKLSLDPAHPSLDHAVLPGKLALDMLHLGAWTTVSDEVDRYLYIDLNKIKKLRNPAAGSGTAAMSLAQIGREVGASHEAVRQNLAYAAEKPARTGGGLRVVSGGARLLKTHLGLDD